MSAYARVSCREEVGDVVGRGTHVQSCTCENSVSPAESERPPLIEDEPHPDGGGDGLNLRLLGQLHLKESRFRHGGTCHRLKVQKVIVSHSASLLPRRARPAGRRDM